MRKNLQTPRLCAHAREVFSNADQPLSLMLTRVGTDRRIITRKIGTNTHKQLAKHPSNRNLVIDTTPTPSLLDKFTHTPGRAQNHDRCPGAQVLENLPAQDAVARTDELDSHQRIRIALKPQRLGP